MKSNSSSSQHVAIPMGSQPPQQSSSSAATAQSFSNKEGGEILSSEGEKGPVTSSSSGMRSQKEMASENVKKNRLITCGRMVGFLIVLYIFLYIIGNVLLYLVAISVGILSNLINPSVIFQPPPKFKPSPDIKQISIIRKLQNLYEKRDPRKLVGRHILMASIPLIIYLSVGFYKRRDSILGYPVWKWMVLLSVINFGRQIMTLFSVIFHYFRWSIMASLGLTQIEEILESSSFCYYVCWLVNPVITVFYWVALNLIWGKLFSGKNNDDQQLSLVRWIFVCFFIGSVLFFVKTFLLLKWMADMVFRRFRERILQGALQLYFFTLFFGLRLTIINPRAIIDKRQRDKEADHSMAEVQRHTATGNYVVSNNPTVYDLREITRYFLDIALASTRRDEDLDDEDQELRECCSQISLRDDHVDEDEELRGNCSQIGPRDVQYITKKDLMNRFGFEDKDADLFMQELEATSSQLTSESFYKWMLDVRNNSLDLGYTLGDVGELVAYLNNIMNVVIAAIVILTWLLVTGVASYKLLAVIASPFVAAAFIFGDMLKRVFEGIIFTFVSHPFIIGDQCIIEGNTLEVKKMGIMRTRFNKVGTNKQFSYANSELASKVIVNVSADSGGDDQVELNLDASTISKSSIKDLREMINCYLHDNENIFTSHLEVNVKELGSAVKMTVSYQQTMKIHDLSIVQRLHRERKHKAKFLEDLNEMLLKAKIKYADSS